MSHRKESAHASWLTLPSHLAWLNHQFNLQVAFAAQARLPQGGFGYLDANGRVDGSRNREIFLTCRITHVASLAHLRGVPGAMSLVDHGIDALQNTFRDYANDGWYTSLNADGTPAPGRKAAYDHAFVLLASASATVAGRPGASELLLQVLGIIDQYFWDDEAGLTRESFAFDWSDPEEYRGANSNMHMVEALLAAGDALSDPALSARTLRIADALINKAARAQNWLLPEHFDADWNPELEYNRDQPAHPFRPYGATPGHFLEWARLLIQVRGSIAKSESAEADTDWIIPAAEALFDRAIEVGWKRDGNDGFVYTVGWDGAVIIDARMHWVLAEGIGAAALLSQVTDEPRFAEWYQRFWDHASRYFVEPLRGTWIHELDKDLAESGLVWPGRPDVYHVSNALLIPQLPPAPAAAVALRDLA